MFIVHRSFSAISFFYLSLHIARFYFMFIYYRSSLLLVYLRSLVRRSFIASSLSLLLLLFAHRSFTYWFTFMFTIVLSFLYLILLLLFSISLLSFVAFIMLPYYSLFARPNVFIAHFIRSSLLFSILLSYSPFALFLLLLILIVIFIARRSLISSYYRYSFFSIFLLSLLRNPWSYRSSLTFIALLSLLSLVITFLALLLSIFIYCSPLLSPFSFLGYRIILTPIALVITRYSLVWPSLLSPLFSYYLPFVPYRSSLLYCLSFIAHLLLFSYRLLIIAHFIRFLFSFILPYYSSIHSCPNLYWLVIPIPLV